MKLCNVISGISYGMLSVALLMSFPLSAVANDPPATLAGATLVTAEKAMQMVNSGVLMIDTRVANEYADLHIKGAKNIPYVEKSARALEFDAAQDRFDLTRLPADKNAPVVFYCNSGECWKSYKAATVAIKAGYKKVIWFRGGFPEWKARGYPLE